MIEKPDLTQLQPAHNYPTDYGRSWSEIEIRMDGHAHICGSGRRTGLTVTEGWPVYLLESRCRPDLNGWYAALSPEGFVMRGRSA